MSQKTLSVSNTAPAHICSSKDMEKVCLIKIISIKFHFCIVLNLLMHNSGLKFYYAVQYDHLQLPKETCRTSNHIANHLKHWTRKKRTVIFLQIQSSFKKCFQRLTWYIIWKTYTKNPAFERSEEFSSTSVTLGELEMPELPSREGAT